jgi:hypothetical protein
MLALAAPNLLQIAVYGLLNSHRYRPFYPYFLARFPLNSTLCKHKVQADETGCVSVIGRVLLNQQVMSFRAQREIPSTIDLPNKGLGNKSLGQFLASDPAIH